MITKKRIGQVTIDEKNEIQKLFERRNGLVELAKVIEPSNDELYEKVVNDMGITASKFQEWWNEKAQKYEWERSENGQWEIDFDTCDIYLISN
ncbi:MAG: CXXX repeat peptide modification system protein [Prevotella sp.]